MAQPTTHPIPNDPKYDYYDFPTVSLNQASGHPGHTTDEQDAKVHQLRSTLEQAGCKDQLDTLTMLRFLRARKFVVEDSKTMFLAYMKWRKEFHGGVDHLVRTFDYKERPKVTEYYPQYYHKTDKQGRPIYIEELDKVDVGKLKACTTIDRMKDNLVVEYEKVANPRLPACSRKTGALHETCCTIMDARGVGLWKAGKVWNFGYVTEASAISQNYYPERLGKLYIVNTSDVFKTIYGWLGGYLDQATKDKVKLLGDVTEKKPIKGRSGKYEYVKLPEADELLKDIPAENLPVMFGGTCVCPEGCLNSDAGPWQESQWLNAPAQAGGEDGVIVNKPSSITGSSGQAPSGTDPGPATGNAPAHT